MATHQISILGPSTCPDPASGNVFMENYLVKATNDIFKHLVFVFNDTATKDPLYGTFLVPQNYVGTSKILVEWTSTATTGNVVWEFAYRNIASDDSASLDQATVQETPSGLTDVAPTAANNRLIAAGGISPTSANFTVGSRVEFKLSRDGTSGSDTMAAAAQLVDLIFQYSDV